MLLFSLGLLAVASVLAADLWIRHSAEDRCFQEVAQVPIHDVALVLGCSPKIGSRPNRFFEYRMDAAAALYQAGRVKAFIVSGDHGTRQYDEPTAMKEALVARSVPADAVYLDHAGFRTLDSVVRAQRIFGQSAFVIVSQRFHNERALFLAEAHGLKAVGYDAADVPTHQSLRTTVREYLARVKAVLDVKVFNTQPKFDGPPVVITQGGP